LNFIGFVFWSLVSVLNSVENVFDTTLSRFVCKADIIELALNRRPTESQT